MRIAMRAWVAGWLCVSGLLPLLAQKVVMPPGAGTLADPYRISELGHLAWMDSTAAESAGKHYALVADIDATETAGWNDTGTDEAVLEGFHPIGSHWIPFAGVFDGQGHVIRGLTMDRRQNWDVGLFGTVDTGATVMAVGLAGARVQVRGDLPVGGLVGENAGTVSRCYVAGLVRGPQTAGGLVGTNTGTIRQCCAMAAVSGAVGWSGHAGGLVGEVWGGTVSECLAAGTVTGHSPRTGGLAGAVEPGAVVTASFWDREVSRCDLPGAGTGLPTDALQHASTYAGWDFDATWGIAEGRSYPYPRWSPPPFGVAVVARGPGSVTVDPLWTAYAPGTVVTVSAAADAGAEFVEWLGPVVAPTSTVSTATVAGPTSLVAVFRVVRSLSSIEGLQSIGNDPDFPLDGRYSLAQDLDARGTAAWNDEGTDTAVREGFRPIGNAGEAPFCGSFDGQGHVIRGLTIGRPHYLHSGLFGYVGAGGTVRNLGLADVVVARGDYTGALAGGSAGVVACCGATGAVTAGYFGGTSGGLVGMNEGEISECYARVVVMGPAGSGCAGGLVGFNDGVVNHGYATGFVTGPDIVGGLIGVGSGSASGYGVRCGYWDRETSQCATSMGGSGRTTAQMRTRATYEGYQGWNFVDTWAIAPGMNDGYPYLRGVPPPASGSSLAAIGAGDVALGRGVWDVTGAYRTTVAGYRLDLDLRHDPSGKLNGTAVYRIPLNDGRSLVQVTAVVKGRVKGTGAGVGLSATAKGTAPDRQARFALKLVLDLDPTSRQLRGAVSGRLRSSAGTTPIAETLALDLPAAMDGTWVLQVDAESPDGALERTATLLLPNGVGRRCQALLAAGEPPVALGILGDPADPASKAIRMRATITPLAPGWFRLDALTAVLYGQTIAW